VVRSREDREMGGGGEKGGRGESERDEVLGCKRWGGGGGGGGGQKLLL